MKHSEEIEVKRGSSEWAKYANHLSSSDSDRVTVYYKSDGSIDEEKTYTSTYRNELAEQRGQQTQDTKSKGKTEEKKESCLMKIIKAPFRLIWWLLKFILKTVLTILTLGLISNFLNKDKD